MSINATVDGVTYYGITTIAVGGKTVALVESSSGGGDDSSVIWFDDRNDYVKSYLTASENYTAANRSTVSVVQQYASSSVADQDCPKPYNGVYNLFPGVDNTVGNATVRRSNYAPRMIKMENVWNVRDVGGWSCDGGNIRFGKIFRGSRIDNASASDLSLLQSIGVKLELDIRDSGNAASSTNIPGASFSHIAMTKAYGDLVQDEPTALTTACQTAMQSVVNGNPVYIHCASGADRTGCVCAMLEAVCGVSDKDIDREYELTCFSDVEDQLTGRVRTGSAWPSFWAALPNTQASSKLNVIQFLQENGVATSLINSFRQAMIDGTPGQIDGGFSVTNNLTRATTNNNATNAAQGSSYQATITPAANHSLDILKVTMGGVDITSSVVTRTSETPIVTAYTITNNLRNVVNSNPATTTNSGTSYTATLTIESGYVLTDVEIHMGGVDITATVYTSGTINIPNVTGNIVIFAIADSANYTNLVRQAQELDSTAIYNGVGYKNGYYLSGGNEAVSANDCVTGCIPYTIEAGTQPTDILYLKGYSGSASASHTRMQSLTTDKSERKGQYEGFLNTNTIFDVELLSSGYYKLTPKSGIHNSVNGVGWLRFSFVGTDGANIIITKNEPIE